MMIFAISLHLLILAWIGIDAFADPDGTKFVPFGYQSGLMDTVKVNYLVNDLLHPLDDDSFGGSMHYDHHRGLIYVTGGTYSRFWDGVDTSSVDIDNTHLGQSDCFLAVWKLPKDNDDDGDLKLLYSSLYGQVDADEACSSLLVHEHQSDDGNHSFNQESHQVSVMILGTTSEGGFLTSFSQHISTDHPMSGFAMKIDLEFNRELPDDSTTDIQTVHGTINSGKLMDFLKVEYPIAVVNNAMPTTAYEYIRSDDANIHNYYIVSIGSDDTTYEPGAEYSFEQGQNSLFADNYDYTTGGGMDIPKYGLNFKIVARKYTEKTQAQLDYEAQQEEFLISLFGEEEIQSVQRQSAEGVEDKMATAWTKLYGPFLPNVSSNEPNELRVADVAYLPNSIIAMNSENILRDDLLVIVGHSKGSGPAFGGELELNPPLMPNKNVTHGFVTKLNPSTGQLTKTGGIVQSNTIGGLVHETNVHGMCFQTGLEDIHYIYVVGSINGRIDFDMNPNDLSTKSNENIIARHAFITKIRMDNLEPVWSRQLGTAGGTDVAAYGCTVTNDGTTVYMAGTIFGTDQISIPDQQSQNSQFVSTVELPFAHNGSDIFVAKYNTNTNGALNWVRQIGTSEDDQLARGKGITCDTHGNAIIVGNTRGSMFRNRGYEITQDFVEVQKNDVFIMSIGREDGSTKSILDNEKHAGTTAGTPSGPTGGNSNNNENASGNTNNSSEILPDDISGMSGFLAFIITLCAITAFLLIIFVGYKVGNVVVSSSDGNKQKGVMEYLEDFEDDEVDLHVRKSATGGYHGIYDFDSAKDGDLDDNSKFPGEVTVNFDGNENGSNDEDDDLLNMNDAFNPDDDSDNTFLAHNQGNRHNMYSIEEDDHPENNQNYGNEYEKQKSPPQETFTAISNPKKMDGNTNAKENDSNDNWGMEII